MYSPLRESALPKPQQRQCEVLYLPTQGHSVVKGIAGGGKTTMAIYRALFLSDSTLPHGGNTIVLTYNRSLANNIEAALKLFPHAHVQVSTYHALVKQGLRQNGHDESPCPDKLRKEFIAQAVQNVQDTSEPVPLFKRELDFFVDEIDWMVRMGICSLEDYVEAERIGRKGHTLLRKDRPLMYKILEQYNEVRTSGNNGQRNAYLYDWDNIVLAWYQYVLAGKISFPYRHIIIDEGQDFPISMLKGLSKLLSNDGSLTVFLDDAQQIYGPRISWRSAGLSISKAWTLHNNYRNTAQIYRLAQALAKNLDELNCDKDSTLLDNNLREGNKPYLFCCDSPELRYVYVANICEYHASISKHTESIGILVFNYRQEKELQYYFAQRNIPTLAVSRGQEGSRYFNQPGIYISSIFSAKGLEFDFVILPFLDKENFIDPNDIDEDDSLKQQQLVKSLKLLYVAITRARNNLFLMYCDELTPLLPKDKDLYNRVQGR